MDLEELFDKLSPHIPEKIALDFIELVCEYENRENQNRMIKINKKITPAMLRFTVTSRPFAEFFLHSGKITVENLKESLQKINKNISSFKNILEFGCGCARLVIWFEEDLKNSNYVGTDINQDAIKWCKENLNFGTFDVNEPTPPLKYDSESFDFIYSYSVFTHLNEEDQKSWLQELHRITKKDGIVLLTVRGNQDYEKRTWGEKDIKELNEKGFLFRRSNLWTSIFPDGYQNAYHTKKYIEEKFTKYFKILEYIPIGQKKIGQDIVLMKK